MPREDVPYPGAAICSIKERIEEIADEVDQKLETINGVPGDGSGNVKIISGHAAVVITNDAPQNEVSVGLDTTQLPAATVSSVNGQTGAVVLDGTDIQVGSGYINATAAISALKTQTTQTANNLLTETTNRQNADATLQGNINAALATIPGAAATAVSNDATVQQLSSDVTALQAADAQNVKISGSQTVTGNKTFSGGVTLSGNAFANSEIRIRGGTAASPFLKLDAYGTNFSYLSATNNSRTILISLDNDSSIRIPTPISAANTSAAVNIAYVSDTGGSLNNLLHTAGNETKSGNLTLNGNSKIKVPFLRDSNPAATSISSGFIFEDNDGNNVCNLNTMKEPNGAMRSLLTISNDINGTVYNATLRFSITAANKTVLQIVDTSGAYHTIAEY